MTNLGHGYFELGDLGAAETHYQQALELRRTLDQPNLATEPLAGLARVFMERGDLPAAQKPIREIMTYLDRDGSLDGTDEPLRVLLTCCRVLDSVDDPRARTVLADAYDQLMERADRLALDVRCRNSTCSFILPAYVRRS